MDPQRSGTLCLLKLLTEHSDEDHILSMKDMIRMFGESGIKTERRTVYRYINTLLYMGYDISVYSENGKGYYLRGRPVDKNGARLIEELLCLREDIPQRLKNEIMSGIGAVQCREGWRRIKHVKTLSDPFKPKTAGGGARYHENARRAR